MKAAKEALPNPGDMFQSLRYVQDQAARGHFKGRPVAQHVLLYLVMNMWTRVPNNDDAGLGEVMYGRSSIDTIAAGTALSRRSVQRALTWLAEAEWIDTQRTRTGTGREDRRYLCVRLDMPAHRGRERLREAGEALDSIIREGVRESPREGVRESPS